MEKRLFERTPSASSYAATFVDGKAMWGSLISLTKSASSSNTLTKTYNSNTSKTAITAATATTDGHVINFTITVNSYNYDNLLYAAQKRTMAHEVGHIFFLNDLTSSASSERIMYAYSSTTKEPQVSDMDGVRFSSHLHKQADHTAFSYQVLTSYLHAKVCGECYGYYKQSHTLYSGTCIYCGYTQ